MAKPGAHVRGIYEDHFNSVDKSGNKKFTPTRMSASFTPLSEWDFSVASYQTKANAIQTQP